MSERTIGFSIEIKGTESEIGKLAELKQEILAAEKDVKKLTEATKGNIGAQKASATQMAELELKVKTLKKEYSEQQKTISNTIVANKAEAGSNEQLRAQLSLRTAEYNKLSKEQRDNTQHGIDLKQIVSELTETLKNNEGAIGDNRRKVGGYSDALKDLKADLRAAQAEMTRIASTSGVQSKEFNQAAKDAGALKDQIDDVKAATKQMAVGSGIGQFKNQLLGVGQSLKDLDFKEAAERAKALGVTAKTLTFKEMIGGAKNAAIAFYEMAAAFLATPFGMVAAAIGVVVGALAIFVNASHNSTAEVLSDIDKMDKKYKALFDAKIALQKAYGLDTKNTELQALAAEKYFIEQRLDTLVKQADTISGLNDEEEKEMADLMERRFKTIVEYAAKEIEIKKEASDKTKKELEKHLEEEKKKSEKLKELRKKESSELVTAIKENNAIILQLAKDIAKGNVDALEDGYEKEKAVINNKYDELIKAEERKLINKKKLRADEIEVNRLANERIFQLIAGNAKEIEKLDESTSKKRTEAAIRHNELSALIEVEGVKQSKKTEEDKAKAILDIQKKAAQSEIDILEASSDAQKEEVRLRIAQLKTLIVTEGKPAPGKSIIEQLFGTQNKAVVDEALKSVLDISRQIANAQYQANAESNARLLEQQVNRLSDQHDTEVLGLQARLQSGSILQAQFDAEKKASDEKFRKLQLAAQEEAFEKEKDLKIKQIEISTAIAIAEIWLKSLAQTAPIVPAGIALAAVATGAALTGASVQISAIRKQKFREGGVLEGPSHEENGIPFTINGQPGFEAEGDEILLTKGVYRNQYLRNLASQINVAGGGRSFAAGGPLPVVNTAPSYTARFNNDGFIEKMSHSLANKINDKKVTLQTQEVTKSQNELSLIDRESTF